jgi:hypothetical protein
MTKDELDKLAHSLAFEVSLSAIECEAILHKEDGWMDISDAAMESIRDYVRYFETRGLLERHPERSDWVRVRDESEAVIP